jgi:hypothetical protein
MEIKECFICGKYTQTERHHIFGGFNRPKSEKYKLTVDLCTECHRTGKNAVHRNADTMQMLHIYGEQKALKENGWSIEDFRQIFGVNYL